MILSGFILSCFLTLLLILVTKYVWEYLRKVRVMLQLQGPKGLPLIGNVLLINDHKSLVEIGTHGYQKYGPIMRVWISFMPVFVLFDPNYIHKVLSDVKHNNKNFFYHLMHNFLGEGLVTSEGSTWRNHRRLLSPLFHTNYLKQFVKYFAENAEDLVNEMLDNQGDINVTSFCNKCVFHTLTQNVLGLKEINMESSPYRKCQVHVASRVSKPWLLFDWIFRVTNAAKAELDHKDELYKHTQKVVKEKMSDDKKSLLDYDEDKFTSFVNFMLDVNKKHPEIFTIKDVIDEACTFTLAGQESVASAAAFALHLLATHSEIQAKCREEVDLLSEETLYSFEGLRELTFLENCIKETLRLFPSLPIIGRRLGSDLKLDTNLILPAGSQIIIAPFVTHRIPDLYPDPEEFRPERFEQYPSGCKNPYAYIPFSSGLRKCIGYQYAMLELKCILAAFLRRFILEPTARTKTPNLAYRITLRAKGGLWVRFRPREGVK